MAQRRTSHEADQVGPLSNCTASFFEMAYWFVSNRAYQIRLSPSKSACSDCNKLQFSMAHQFQSA